MATTLAAPAVVLSDEHEEVRVRRGPRSGLPTVVAVHTTYRGRALGGCRLWTYPELDDAVRDAERLARAMTFKAAAADVPLGGAKGVIAVPAGEQLTADRRRAALLDFAELVDAFGGRYITAEDVGVSVEDMALMRTVTPYVVGGPREGGGSGDPSAMTARGVEVALRAALAHAFGDEDPRGRHVVVAGLGHVGSRLAERLAQAGAQLTVSDIDEGKRALADRLGAGWTTPDDALATEADVLAPCALGGVLDDDTVPRLRVRVVCGAANNQLAQDRVADQLHARGILWTPDFVANAGGLINVACELDGYDEARALRRVDGIADTLREVFARADAEATSTLAAAQALVAERIAARAATDR